MARYQADSPGHDVVVEVSWSGRCRMLVDGREVDSGGVWMSSVKLQDTTPNGSGALVNVDGTSWSSRVFQLVDGEQRRLSKVK